jgi:2-phospho-L-lactate transferase/gluconeogenesis factor (CofD/UPF0052 family)
MTDPNARVNVVLFTGGRGSSVLSSELIKSDRIALTLAINGYDDGLSTGEVRRFLGDCLGPSDFRKNASRLASRLRTCDERLVSILDLRFPVGYGLADAVQCFRLLRGGASPADEFQAKLARLVEAVGPRTLEPLAVRLDRFEAEAGSRPFAFGDCSIGNLVFAGCFLHVGRQFNPAVEDYCGLLQLAPGLIENVTDGRNACLVAVDQQGRLLATEEAIVTSATPQHLQDIYLLDRTPAAAEVEGLAAGGPEALARYLAAHSVTPAPNPRLLEKIARADLIVYAPGTQHSSLFPSYLTPGIGAAIARNFKAVKVLITNLHEDAEIFGNSAVDLINKALYYLTEKRRLSVPTPALITHYLLNEPGKRESGAYVPLGHLESLEDPRLVRIGNYEEGVSGRHDAAKVLTPFIKSFLRRGERQRLAILLVQAESLNKVAESIVEMVRAGIAELPVVATVYYECAESFPPEFVASLPFDVRNLDTRGGTSADAFERVAHDGSFDYVMLFESSGMYRGDDVVSLAMHLAGGRLDAVWGSRRLSVNDIKQAYRLAYRHRSIKAAVSYVGSHLLSLSYLVLYGRYISDTLSGVRVVRSTFLREESLDYQRRDFNQLVLGNLLRRRAEVFETPVYYIPLSPQKIRRTTVTEGLVSLLTILRGRWRRLPESPTPSSLDDMVEVTPADPFTAEIAIPK